MYVYECTTHSNHSRENATHTEIIWTHIHTYICTFVHMPPFTTTILNISEWKIFFPNDDMYLVSCFYCTGVQNARLFYSILCRCVFSFQYLFNTFQTTRQHDGYEWHIAGKKLTKLDMQLSWNKRWQNGLWNCSKM